MNIQGEVWGFGVAEGSDVDAESEDMVRDAAGLMGLVGRHEVAICGTGDGNSLSCRRRDGWRKVNGY